MEKKKFADTPTAELKKNHKTLAAITGMFVGMLLVLAALNLYLAIKNRATATAIIPIALMPIALINFKNLKNIKAEIKARELAGV